ncbi:MAG: CocE/NonD family hydrolase, partial [Sphingomonas sp.]
MNPRIASVAAAALACSLAVAAVAQQSSQVTPDMVQTGSDIPKDWQQPEGNFDYTRKEVMIPMRDGVKLHTVILIPKGAHDLPMLLERTPYDATSTNSTN